MIYRISICILLMMTLTACLGNLSKDGIMSTMGSSAATAIGTAAGGPIVGATVGVAAGVATDVVTTPPSSPQDFSGADGELNFWEMLAFMWSNFTQHLIGLGVVAGVVWILTGYLGLRARRPEEKKLEKILVNKMKET